VILFAAALPRARSEQKHDAIALLTQALHFADLYNWVNAAPDFAEAETMFLASGDRKNALYARLGVIRTSLEHGGLPALSAELAARLQDDPVLQNDKQIRMFCLIVKGDIDGESDHEAMRHDWEEVWSLARDLHDAEWENRAIGELGMAAFYDGDIQTARKNVGQALKTATATNDVGGQILFQSVMGNGLTELHMYDRDFLF
jgi:hypothetical protein